MTHDLVYQLTLKPGVDREDYERWAREVDLPLTLRQPGVISYTISRLERPVEGVGPVARQYLEVIRVKDADAYLRGCEEDPEVRAMLAQWDEFVEAYDASAGVSIQ